jgi:hypothetical protein
MSTTAPPRPVETFAAVFGEEHRVIRDLLLALVAAFEARDPQRALPLLVELAGVAGPHFRYEEESLYPALVPLFGAEYVDKLLSDHDVAIGSATRLVELSRRDALTAEEVAEAVRLLRGILPHVSDCDGLSIMVELLPDAAVESLLDSRQQAREAGLDLLDWAETVRARPAAAALPI